MCSKYTLEVRNAYKIVVRKPERQRPLETPGSGYYGIITIDLIEVECEGVDWIHLTSWWLCKCTLDFGERQGMFYETGQERLCCRELVIEIYCLECGCVSSGRNL